MSFAAVALYGLTIVGTILAFGLIRRYGETLTPPVATEPATAAAAGAAEPAPLVPADGHPLLHVLLALTAVIVLGRLLGALFERFQQPPVIGEVVAGILLGPSLLGAVAPRVSAFLLPDSIAPHLQLVAQLGVILYMFTVGLELDTSALRRRGHAAVAISHAGIMAPFLLGALLALGSYSVLSRADVPFTVFALFLGASMSVTAFPVLARILTDRGLQRTELGTLALACAAADDVTAWCLLAFVVGVAHAEVGGALLVVPLTLGYIAVVFLIGRPLLRRWVAWTGDALTPGVVAAVFAALLASAAWTEAIGIHAIFGAFVLGASLPRDCAIARELPGRVNDLVGVVLLPAFFAVTGMRTQIGLVSGWENWLWCLAIVAVATLGKAGGSLAAARLAGFGWRDSAALGILMNTRGLMELIVLNVGLELGVISDRLFAMLVLMALVTTIGTTPALRLLGAAWAGRSPALPGEDRSMPRRVTN